MPDVAADDKPEILRFGEVRADDATIIEPADQLIFDWCLGQSGKPGNRLRPRQFATDPFGFLGGEAGILRKIDIEESQATFHHSQGLCGITGVLQHNAVLFENTGLVAYVLRPFGKMKKGVAREGKLPGSRQNLSMVKIQSEH